MQSKYVRMLSDEHRICRACEMEPSPHGGKSDDLRYFDQGLYHPTCHEEVDRLTAEFNERGVPRETALEILKHLGISSDVISVNGQKLEAVNI